VLKLGVFRCRLFLIIIRRNWYTCRPLKFHVLSLLQRE